MGGPTKREIGMDPEKSWDTGMELGEGSSVQGAQTNADFGMSDFQIRNPNAVAMEKGTLDKPQDPKASLSDVAITSPTTWLALPAMAAGGMTGAVESSVLSRYGKEKEVLDGRMNFGNAFAAWTTGKGDWEDVVRSVQGKKSLAAEELEEMTRNVDVKFADNQRNRSGVGQL